MAGPTTASPATHLRGVALTAPWVLWLLAADVLLSSLLPLKPFCPDLVYAVSSQIASTVWAWIQRIFESTNGARVGVSGDLPRRGESAVVVANHVSWADFYMVQALARKAGMLGRCRWLAKRQLRWVPFLGWGLWAMGMPMVSRNWLKDQGELAKVYRGIVERKWPVWLISFSEATRFTPAKFAASHAWCATANRPQPQHLLYPRTKGFVTTVQHLRRGAPHVKTVYDVTIAYQHRGQWHAAPSIWETLSLPDLTRAQGWRFHVHARSFPIEDLPEDNEGLAKWLEKVWLEKGEWLEEKRLEWAGQENGN